MKKLSKKAIILGSVVLTAIFVAVFTFNSSAAITGSFSDDFSTTFSVNKDLTSAKIEGGRVLIPDNTVSARVVSTRVHTTSFEIVKAKINATDEKPKGSRIIYYLSNDSGRNWLQITPGFFYDFNIKDGGLKWMAVLARGDNNRSPLIDKIVITFKEDSESLRNSNDSRRVSDLASVAAGLERFYKDFNQYPHVEGVSSLERWNNLRALLNRKSQFTDYYYVYSWPNDPLHNDEDKSQDYDYQDFNGSQNYVLAARFENPQGFALASDLDGRVGNIDCNDPVYCVGSSQIAAQTQSWISPTSTSIGGQVSATDTTSRITTTTTETFDPSGIQGMVTNILAGIYGPIAKPSVIGGGTYIQEETTITQTGETVTDDSRFDNQYFDSLRRGFLVKLRGDTEIYEVIKGQKHWIPNASVFEDYGFKAKDVRIIERSEFNIYPRTKLLRALGDSRIYYLTEQGRIREIPNAEIFFSYGNRFDDIIDISVTELNSYPPIKCIFLETREDTRVWLIDGNIKHPISSQALIRLKISWQEIAPVNRTEFDYYRVGDEIK